MKRAEKIMGALLLLFGLYLAYESTRIETGADSGTINAGFMPFWLSVSLVITSAALLVRAFALPSVRFAPAFFTDRTGRRRVFLVLAGYLFAVAAMKPMGMLISLTFLMAVTMPVFGSRDWKAITLASILIPVCVYVLFRLLLKVDLPMGILENVSFLY